MAEEKQLDPLQSLIYNGGRAVGDIGEMIGDGVGAVQDGFNTAGEWVGDRVEDVQNGINAAGQAVTDAGQAVADTAGAGVEAVVDWGQGVADYWGGIPALAQEGFDAGLTDDTTLMADTVAEAMEGFGAGAANEKSLGASDLFDGASKAIGESTEKLTGSLKDFVDRKSSTFESAIMDPVQETVESARQHASEMTM